MDDDERVTHNKKASHDGNAANHPGDLARVAQGETPLREAFLTLAHYQDAQPRMAKDLLEREVWAVTALLEESSAIWDHLPRPTLRFPPNGNGPEPSHIELGRFCHLAAPSAPREGERTLIAATSPCWARVSRDPERERCGYNGPLGCRYEPISGEEAVATLGLGPILAQIEAATREASVAVLAEAQSQEERDVQLLPIEHMLGWQADPTPERPRSLSMRLLLCLTAHRGAWLVVATCLVLVMVPLCFLFSLPVIFAILPSMGVLVWKCL